jgi:hypothetical protein
MHSQSGKGEFITCRGISECTVYKRVAAENQRPVFLHCSNTSKTSASERTPVLGSAAPPVRSPCFNGTLQTINQAINHPSDVANVRDGADSGSTSRSGFKRWVGRAQLASSISSIRSARGDFERVGFSVEDIFEEQWR